jgi:hypothetical protein
VISPVSSNLQVFCGATAKNLLQKYKENFFQYDLVVYVEVPETSSVDIAHRISPIATLGRYEGLMSDAGAPQWTKIATRTTFEIRQPSSSMADVFTEIAFWPENTDIVCYFIGHDMLIAYANSNQPLLSGMMLTWAEAVSVSSVSPLDMSTNISGDYDLRHWDLVVVRLLLHEWLLGIM